MKMIEFGFFCFWCFVFFPVTFERITFHHLIWLLFWFSWSCFTIVDQSRFPEMSVLCNCTLSPCQLLSMSEEQIDDGFTLPPEPVTDNGEMTRLMLQHCVMPTYQFIIQVAPDQSAVTHQCTSCFQESVFSLSVKKRGNLSLDYSSDLRLTTYLFFSATVHTSAGL